MSVLRGSVIYDNITPPDLHQTPFSFGLSCLQHVTGHMTPPANPRPPHRWCRPRPAGARPWTGPPGPPPPPRAVEPPPLRPPTAPPPPPSGGGEPGSRSEEPLGGDGGGRGETGGAGTMWSSLDGAGGRGGGPKGRTLKTKQLERSESACYCYYCPCCKHAEGSLVCGERVWGALGYGAQPTPSRHCGSRSPNLA